MSKNKWVGRVFLGRDDEGKQRYHYVGRFPTRRERNDAVAEARARIKREGCDCKDCKAMGRKGLAKQVVPTIGEQLERYLAAYGRRNRSSSLDTQETRLARFREDFGDRRVDDVTRAELEDWMLAQGAWAGEPPVPRSYMAGIVGFFNWTVKEDEVLTRNPARGLSERSRGRADQPPPTEEEFEALIAACDVHGSYGPMMRAHFLFCAFTLWRPSESFELKESDIDFRRRRISKARRLYRGSVDEPKTGRKVTALPEPARNAIAPILPGDGGYVFRNKSGRRLQAPTHHGYWKQVLAKAGLDFDFYHATKHYGVHFMWTQLGLSERAIAAQAGWRLSTVTKMLETYGHGDLGALEEIDRAFADRPNVGLRVIDGGRG